VRAFKFIPKNYHLLTGTSGLPFVYTSGSERAHVEKSKGLSATVTLSEHRGALILEVFKQKGEGPRTRRRVRYLRE